MSGKAKNIAPNDARRDGLRAWGLATLLLIAAVVAGQAIPWIDANLGFIAALIFVLVPGYFLRKRGEHESSYGLEFGDWKRGIIWGGVATLVTIALFSPAYHLWETRVEHRAANIDVGNYRQLPMTWYGAPQQIDDGQVHLWTWGQQIYLVWKTSKGPWELQVTPEGADGAIFDSVQAFADNTPVPTWVRSGERPTAVHGVLHARGAHALQIHATAGGQTLGADNVLAGASARAGGQEQGDHTRVPLGYGWMLSLLLTQLILVAVPEEFFFRGFLQERLHQAWGRDGIHIWGLPLTWGIVVSSVLFALVHLISNLSPARLTVFFPSLLFGALRERTGGITASVVYHAACNLLVLFLSVHYF